MTAIGLEGGQCIAMFACERPFVPATLTKAEVDETTLRRYIICVPLQSRLNMALTNCNCLGRCQAWLGGGCFGPLDIAWCSITFHPHNVSLPLGMGHVIASQN